MIPRDYHPQGVIGLPILSIGLFFAAALCLGVFVVRVSRSGAPASFFGPEFALAVAPLLCAGAYLVVFLLGLVDLSHRVDIYSGMLQHRIAYAMRIVIAATASSCVALLVLLVRTRTNSGRTLSADTPIIER